MRTSIAATMAKKLATVMMITSRFAMCESSCASTPSISLLEALPQAPSDRDSRLLRAPTGREGVRNVGVDHGDARLREVGQRAEPLDHVVQLGRLLALDDLGPGRGERELVRREELEEAGLP